MNNRSTSVLGEFSWNVQSCSLENIKQYLSPEIDTFIKNIKKCAKISQDKQIHKLLNSKSVDRFEAISKSFALELPDSIPEKERLDSAFLIRQWIILGAVVETVLQIFLTVYLSDYRKSSWNLWKNFNESFKSDIFKLINEKKESKIITKAQSESFKSAIKEKIREHSQQVMVDKLMLDSLIQFYEKEKIVDAQFVAELRIIQKNRNCVHLFSDRQIDDINQLIHSIYFLGRLIHELIFRMPLEDIE